MENKENSLVSRAGLEPATLCLKGRCSNHLSYRPPWGLPSGLSIHDNIGTAHARNIAREKLVA